MEKTCLFILLLTLGVITIEAKKEAPLITIMHLTDVHGWVFGHPHNATLNADFGDLTSLVQHMKSNAEKKGEEFFLCDSGDLIDGTGLSDASPIHGEYILPIVKQVKYYNALAMGNHDIYRPDTVDFFRKTFIPYWNGSYLTANALWKADGSFLGQPYTVQETSNGYTVLYIGFMYNLTQPANNTEVIPVSQALKQPWFQDCMSVKADLIIVPAHIDPWSPPELKQIYTAIRTYHPKTALVMLVGHRHVKYKTWYDDNAFVIESGKYFETMGIIRFRLENGYMAAFSSEWVDTTLKNFYHLAETSESEFLTPEGAAVKEMLKDYYNKLHLNDTVGCAPATYSPNVNMNKDNSLYNLYINTMIPKELFVSMPNTQFVIINAFSLRDSIYEGRVTKNDVYSIMPFGDDFFYYPNVTGSQLQALLNAIQNSPVSMRYKDVHYSSNGQLPTAEQYYHSTVTIQPSDYYDVICAEYDTQAIGQMWSKLFPNNNFQKAPYPGGHSSTDVINNYISNVWPCSNS